MKNTCEQRHQATQLPIFTFYLLFSILLSSFTFPSLASQKRGCEEDKSSPITSNKRFKVSPSDIPSDETSNFSTDPIWEQEIVKVTLSNVGGIPVSANKPLNLHVTIDPSSSLELPVTIFSHLTSLYVEYQELWPNAITDIFTALADAKNLVALSFKDTLQKRGYENWGAISQSFKGWSQKHPQLKFFSIDIDVEDTTFKYEEDEGEPTTEFEKELKERAEQGDDEQSFEVTQEDIDEEYKNRDRSQLDGICGALAYQIQLEVLCILTPMGYRSTKTLSTVFSPPYPRNLRKLRLNIVNAGKDSSLALGKSLQGMPLEEIIFNSWQNHYKPGFLASFFENRPTLEKVCIQGITSFNDKTNEPVNGMTSLAKALSSATKLSKLDLGESEIFYAFNSFVDHLHCTSLHEIDLSYTSFDGGEQLGANLAKLLTNNFNLTSLNLGSCKIQDQGLQGLLNSFQEESQRGKLPKLNLTTLNLNANGLYSPGIGLLLSNLHYFPCLTELDVSSNSMFINEIDPSNNPLIRFISSNTTLQTLKLPSLLEIIINPVCRQQLHTVLQQYTTLKKLVIGSEEILRQPDNSLKTTGTLLGKLLLNSHNFEGIEDENGDEDDTENHD